MRGGEREREKKSWNICEQNGVLANQVDDKSWLQGVFVMT